MPETMLWLSGNFNFRGGPFLIPLQSTISTDSKNYFRNFFLESASFHLVLNIITGPLSLRGGGGGGGGVRGA